MSGRTKHKRYRPRPVTLDPITLAMRRACRVPAAEIAEVMVPIASSFQALREGVATEDQWAVLAGTAELALAIEHKGVMRGLMGHLQAAEAALQAIYRRAMATGTWQRTALYFQEISALDEFIWLHKTQLEALSEGEWRAAHQRAEALVRSARGRVVDLRQLQGQQQLQLTGAAT
jgi:hypothetical protein